MPSYGEKQKPAGIKLPCGSKPLGERKMVSRNSTIKTTLKIDNIPHKLQSNAVLNANK